MGCFILSPLGGGGAFLLVCMDIKKGTNRLRVGCVFDVLWFNYGGLAEGGAHNHLCKAEKALLAPASPQCLEFCRPTHPTAIQKHITSRR